MALGYGSGGILKTARKTKTYTATAGNGNIGSVVLFTITGQVLVTDISAFCTTLLTESGATATMELGVVGSTPLFIAATNAVDIDANEFWVDTAPDAAGIALPAAMKDILINANITNTVAVANVTAGVIEYTVHYLPVSADGLLV